MAVDYQFQTETYVDQPNSSQPVITQAPRRHECLVAGTPVLTDRGKIAIETIQVGDQVLAQHPETGALEFRPVLRCTVRDAGQIHEFRIEDEWIRSSGGHPFWVSGEGWVLASELEVGMMVHGETGEYPILEVRRGGFEPTYNLVVDGFATFFAGEHRVLVHDFTNRRPTRELIPGLNP
ncbi:MAG: polymorphic toxin-type HINT domain-containing protein [Pirellulaceae bacterium]